MSEYDAKLLEMVRASAEVEATIELTGRHRGRWTEVVETVEGEPTAYVYWVRLDLSQPKGYDIVEHPDQDPEPLDLDLKHLIDNDGEV